MNIAYKYIAANNVSSLADLVNESLMENWLPHGPMVYCGNTEGDYYVQPMIKHTEVEPPVVVSRNLFLGVKDDPAYMAFVTRLHRRLMEVRKDIRQSYLQDEIRDIAADLLSGPTLGDVQEQSK